MSLRWWDWDDDKIMAESDALVGPVETFLARHRLNGPHKANDWA